MQESALRTLHSLHYLIQNDHMARIFTSNSVCTIHLTVTPTPKKTQSCSRALRGRHAVVTAAGTWRCRLGKPIILAEAVCFGAVWKILDCQLCTFLKSLALIHSSLHWSRWRRCKRWRRRMLQQLHASYLPRVSRKYQQRAQKNDNHYSRYESHHGRSFKPEVRQVSTKKAS